MYTLPRRCPFCIEWDILCQSEFFGSGFEPSQGQIILGNDPNFDLSTKSWKYYKTISTKVTQIFRGFILGLKLIFWSSEPLNLAAPTPNTDTDKVYCADRNNLWTSCAFGLLSFETKRFSSNERISSGQASSISGKMKLKWINVCLKLMPKDLKIKL